MKQRTDAFGQSRSRSMAVPASYDQPYRMTVRMTVLLILSLILLLTTGLSLRAQDAQAAPAGEQASVALQGDTLWTLQRCIGHAVDQNLTMKRQELLLQSSAKNQFQSKMELLPSLNGNIEHQLGAGRVLDRSDYIWKNQNVSQGDLGLQADLTLFNGLQNYHNIKMNKAGYQSSMQDLEAMEDQITLEVMTAFLELLRSTELVLVAQQKLELTASQVERMERLVEVGKESQGSLLEVNAQHSESKLTYTRALNTRETSRLNLKHLVNIADPVFDVQQPLLPDPENLVVPEYDSVYSWSLANLPQIKSKELNIAMKESQLSMNRGGRSPRLYARGLIYTNYSDGALNPRDPDPSNPTMSYPIGTQIDDNQYRQVALGLSLPIFNNWRVNTNVSLAKIDLADAEVDYLNAVQVLQQTLQSYHSEALSARDHYQSASETVASSEQAFAFAQERFRVGSGTALELQEARNQLYEASSQMISAKYVLIFYTRILSFYMGGDISL